MKHRMIGVLLSGILMCSAVGCGGTGKTGKENSISASTEATSGESTEIVQEMADSSSSAEVSSSSTGTASSSTGKENGKNKIEISLPQKVGMQGSYDTVEGLTMDPGSRIAVVAKDLDSGYWKAVQKGASQAVEELNEALGYSGNDKIQMTFEGTENESDSDTQINTIDTVIGENPDVLVLGIIDEKSGEAQLEDAKQSQIPVVIVDSGLQSDLIACTCATDNEAAAREAARKLCEAIGKSGQVAVVAHQYNTESSIKRVNAFRSEIEENYPNVLVVQVDYGDGEESVSEMLSNTLASYPDLEGIFCTNENMGEETLDALDEMEGTEDIKVVGFDSGKEQIKAIRDGREYGVISQNPYGLGYATIVAAVRAAGDLPLDRFVDTGYQWLDQSSIDLDGNQKYLYD